MVTTGKPALSAKQKEIMDYIKQCILSKGYPPSVREICEAVNLGMPSSAATTFRSSSVIPISTFFSVSIRIFFLFWLQSY